MGNTRCPGKNGRLILGRPQIYYVLERIKRARCFHDIILAVPHESNGGIQLEAARALGVETLDYRGDPNDLIHRYCVAADIMGADIVVRIPGDNTFTDPDEIQRVVSYCAADPGRWDELTTTLDCNVDGNGYPGGLGAEVYDSRFLQWLDRNIVDPRLREHPHKWSFENGQLRTLECPLDIRRPDLKFSVDTEEEFEWHKRVYEEMYPQNPKFGIRDVLAQYMI
jgi:spore coat polysaccharide biosynthesis protein SpsF